jgi:hypothetical protein
MHITPARSIAEQLVAEAGDNVFAQTRRAVAEAEADGDTELSALWREIQAEVLEIGPTGTVYR